LQTDVATELGLTKDQEDAMLGSDTGMTLISAGAGSGKTRVLSGKVANLVNQPEVTPYNIMAVSFSRKSAQDLAEKVKEAVGSKIPQMSHTAIGRTTHSIAQEIVNRFHPQAGSSTTVASKFELDRLIKRAIKLVKETDQDLAKVNDESLFADKIDLIKKQQKRDDLSVLNLLIAVEKYRKDMGFLKDFEKNLVEQLVEIRRKLLKEDALTPQDIKLVSQELATDRGKKVLNKAFAGDSSNYAFNKKKKTASKLDTPMWWGSKAEGKKEPKISPKEAQLFITKCKANMVSPTEAYNRVNKPGMDESFMLKAKVYGAYSHILTEEGLSDFDDMLIEAVKVLSRKDYLKQLQKQYKHIIVDEAQDLNPVQHAFFGLLSGTMEAGGKNGNKPPVPVEAPTMENGRSITFIGDENQSIYGFRGAQSSEFSSKAIQNQGAFDTMTLGVNFRSTKAIVDAANKLISEEDDSLGMICTAVFQEQDNGSDSIKKDTEHQSPYEAAGAFADTVNLGTSGEETYKYSDYGVACRTNAELIPYALSLLEKDIEFTCPVNPFKHPTTKKILRALSLASSMIGGGDGIGQFFGAFLNVHDDLNYGLSDEVNEVFKRHLKNPKSLDELQIEFETRDTSRRFFVKSLNDNTTTRVMVGASS
jgi:superfamily I DNA/RNA helicase